MKRSRAVELVLLASAVAAANCGRRECVDENGLVVDSRYCQGTLAPVGGHGYRWYSNGAFGSYVPVGSSIRSSGTIRGVFGGAGEGAHGGGFGAGE